MLDDLKTQHPNFHYILPAINSEPYWDQNLQPVAVAPHQNMGNRQVDRVSNKSKACTATRNIVERAFARVANQKLSGNQSTLPWQLTLASGVQPTPDLPTIHVWLDVMCVLRRLMTPYYLQYPLAPGVTYSDHGQDLRDRLPKENVLCSTKGLGFIRPDPYALVRQGELNNGTVRMANLFDRNQTGLPSMTEAVFMGLTLGPHAADQSPGYLTDYLEEDVLALQQGNYVDPDTYHQQASQVLLSGL